MEMAGIMLRCKLERVTELKGWLPMMTKDARFETINTPARFSHWAGVGEEGYNRGKEGKALTRRLLWSDLRMKLWAYAVDFVRASGVTQAYEFFIHSRLRQLELLSLVVQTSTAGIGIAPRRTTGQTCRLAIMYKGLPSIGGTLRDQC